MLTYMPSDKDFNWTASDKLPHYPGRSGYISEPLEIVGSLYRYRPIWARNCAGGTELSDFWANLLFIRVGENTAAYVLEFPLNPEFVEIEYDPNNIPDEWVRTWINPTGKGWTVEGHKGRFHQLEKTY